MYVNLHSQSIAMKQILRILFLGLITGFTMSCSGESTEAKEQEPTNGKDEHTFEKVDESSEQKIWPANFETTAGFTKMGVIMDNFTDVEAQEAYVQLEKDLKVEYRLIFKNCTMTGEAHDHLHHYLMPFSEFFKGLTSNNLDLAKSSFSKMKAHLDDYKNHFE
jgi:hypothetical protein